MRGLEIGWCALHRSCRVVRGCPEGHAVGLQRRCSLAVLPRARQTASPLPAPPDQRVFKKHMALPFDAEAFDPGGSSEGFEPEPGLAMTSAREIPATSRDPASVPTNATNTSGTSNVIEQLRSMKNGKAGVVDLRILGSPAAADPPQSR